MMKFIEVNQEKCDSCYKCLRTCPTKAISFSKDSRHVIDNLCIKCGLCLQSCPQDALSVKNSCEQVLDMIHEGQKVIVSIAPSFIGAFGLTEPGKMISMLKYLGFYEVEETAIGADMVVDEYNRFVATTENDVVITSCCPSAYYLIEQHFPYVLNSLIPIVSPMIAHGLSIKKRYGEDVKTVFIGPCLAKMAEAEEMGDAIDAVLTFTELDDLIKKSDKRLEMFEPTPFSVESSRIGRGFPVGIKLNKENNIKYRHLQVEGIESCTEVLREIRSGSLKNCCVEINICDGSCLGGPDMPDNYIGTYGRKLFVKDYIRSTKMHIKHDERQTQETVNVELNRTFSNRMAFQSEPNINMVKNILAKMGKHSKEDELNCGACGYKTCYDKAKAVFYGYSDIETCLPYLREQAVSMQSVMIENSPNAVVLMDKELIVKEVNPMFNRIFNKELLLVEEMPIKLFLDHPIFAQVVETKSCVKNAKIYLDELESSYLVNIVYIDETETLIGFMTDISTDIQRQREFEKVKEETLLKTQEVIDKQMRVAQEIASLLGETTAETKMSLRSLNNLVLNEQGGI